MGDEPHIRKLALIGEQDSFIDDLYGSGDNKIERICWTRRVYGSSNVRSRTSCVDLIIKQPPAPIANPGLDSILAALRPATTAYLYFVACQDASGRQLFAETLDQHIENISIVDQGECPTS